MPTPPPRRLHWGSPAMVRKDRPGKHDGFTRNTPARFNYSMLSRLLLTSLERTRRCTATPTKAHPKNLVSTGTAPSQIKITGCNGLGTRNSGRVLGPRGLLESKQLNGRRPANRSLEARCKTQLSVGFAGKRNSFSSDRPRTRAHWMVFGQWSFSTFFLFMFPDISPQKIPFSDFNRQDLVQLVQSGCISRMFR